MKYIFLSYSTKDSNTAYKLKGFLESDGFVVWMAPLGIPVGKKYPEIIESVIREAELFLLLASNNICKSNWIDKEVERAINYSRKLIIFKIDDCSYNDVFNFLLACVQCSEVIKDISLNDPAFARAYNDLKTLFDSDVPSKQIHIAKNDEVSIKESGLSKEEQIREANNMVKAFMTSKEEVINALTPLHFKDVNKYVFHECRNLNEEQNKVIVDNLLNAYESVFLNPNISGRTEQAIKGQIIYYLTRLNKSNSGLIPKLKQFYYEESNIWIRQSIVYGLGALNEPTIPFEFAKKVYNEEDESLVNRSWTLCFYQDVTGVDPYIYLDDNTSSWDNARKARLDRLAKNDFNNASLIAVDLAILYAFASNRKYHFKPSEKDIITHIKLDKQIKKHLSNKEIFNFIKRVLKDLKRFY